ncbi:MAG: outer membrane beta-barrel protein [Rhodospirillales bacterium]|nr:outer membrane beta-barrel protein [Rhodospirillales bacterium]
MSRPRWLRAGVVGAIVGCAGVAPLRAHAQYVPGEFPVGVPGYGEELGVTVVSRVRPLYEQPGARIGDFIVRANLDESVGYNSNVLGLSGGKGSPVIETRPSLEVNSDWARDTIGASVSADNYQYPSVSDQNRTDWTAAIGGGYTIGRTDLTLSYAHLQQHQSPTAVGAPPTSTPIPFTVDDMRVSYPFELGRLQITPNFEVSLWRYGETTIGGVTSDQSFRNTNEYRGGAAFRYALSGATSLIFTAQGIRSEFNNQPAGTASLSSTSVLALGGIDYQYDGIWRYQALVGLEVRSFDAAQFNTQVAPIARAAVIWTPTELTTVTATLLRAIEDPTQAGTSGYTYTAAELRVDHEYARNLLLRARTGVDVASYLQNGGTQTAVYAGVGATWLINRHLRLSADYTYTTQNRFTSQAPIDGGPAAGTVTPGYSQNLFLVTLHIGL